jgi:hypothetical protein
MFSATREISIPTRFQEFASLPKISFETTPVPHAMSNTESSDLICAA